MLGETMICGKCRSTLEGTMIGGTGANRFGRALMFGTVAAIAGAAVYYAILAATGYSIGLLAILVGYMVGRAVHTGAHGKGGRKYQLLAAFLTYFAISSTYVADGVRQMNGEKSDSTMTRESTTNRPDDSAVVAADGGALASTATRSSASADGTTTPRSTKKFIVAVVTIGIVLLIAPILAGFSSPILLLILGFGVYQAWKMNRGVAVNVSGPFNLKAGTPPAQA